MGEPLPERKEAVSPFPPRRKSPLKSETFRTLFRILSRCSEHPHLCQPSPPTPPRQQQSDNGGNGADNEFSTERVYESTELVGHDGANGNECVAEKSLTANENLESIGLPDKWFSDTELVIDEIDNIMKAEDDGNALNGKNLMDKCVEFRELQELLMDDPVHAVEGDGELVHDNNCNIVTTSPDENKGGGGDDGVLSNQGKNFNPQPTDLKDCCAVQQQKVNDEENFGRNTLGNVFTSLNESLIKEASASTNGSAVKSPKYRITGLAMDHEVQQSIMEPDRSVCSSGALSSRNYGIEDGEREEGEFSSDLEAEERPADNTIVSKNKTDGKEVSEEIIDKSKIPLVEKDEVNSKDSSATLFIAETSDNYNSSLQVEATESARNEMKHKRKVVVYEDPILAEEADQHKKQKKRRVPKKQREVSGANKQKKSDGKVEQTKGSVGRNDVTKPVSSSSDLALSTDKKDQNAGKNPGIVSKDQDVGPSIKKKRGPPSEERKAKKKQQKRKKRAEKNRELGVKRLKLRPVVKPKPVIYCRHFLNGRCHEGEKCKFSHDTTPLTKSKPCCHFARHACMKGDDCPFDHQLSKYPCTNYVSKGYCSRGESCMFSHKLLLEEDVADVTNICTPEVKSHSLSSTSTSKNQEKVVAKSEPNQPAVTLIPKGVCFLSSGKSPIVDSSCTKPGSLSPKKNEGSKVENQKDQSASSSVHKLNEITKGTTRATPPKGINFLSFGKAPLASLTVSSTQPSLTEILQKNELPKLSSHEASADGLRSNTSVSFLSSLRSGSDTSVQADAVPSDKQQSFYVIPKEPTTSPFGSGQSLDVLSHCLKNTPISTQKSLMSTLAFAAKVESEMKQIGSCGSSGSLTGDSAEASTRRTLILNYQQPRR